MSSHPLSLMQSFPPQHWRYEQIVTIVLPALYQPVLMSCHAHTVVTQHTVVFLWSHSMDSASPYGYFPEGSSDPLSYVLSPLKEISYKLCCILFLPSCLNHSRGSEETRVVISCPQLFSHLSFNNNNINKQHIQYVVLSKKYGRTCLMR